MRRQIGYPASPILLTVTEGRTQEISEQINAICHARFLKPGLAGKLFRRLLFCSSQYCGNLGRAMIRALKQRQYESISGWNRQLKAACAFWSVNLPGGRLREVPMTFANIPHVISYSDGERGEARVGVAIYKDGETTEADHKKIPACVRNVVPATPPWRT